MSRSHRVSTREQNGSLTSEPDSISHSAAPQSKAGHGERLQSKASSGERRGSSRAAQRNSINKEKGPDTSTPVKSENEKQQQQQRAPWPGDPIQTSAVRRSLADELDTTHTSADSSVSASADAVRRVNQAAQAMAATGGSYSPAVSSIRHNSTASTFSVSTGTPKRSFVSEYENGTISAQRQELQMLMTELKDRDKELNDMVKAHHHQLVGWEEDRQRVLNLEQRNTQLEAEAKRKNDQVRALVARLKTMESVQQTKQTALDHSQSQLSQLTEQLSQTQLKLKENQEKSRQMSNMVKELSNTLGKLESKEQEMLSLLKLKDQDLTAASSHLSELSSKLKSLDAKVKDAQRAEGEAQRVAGEWKEKYTEIKRVTDKLKSDLNRSQLEEEESRLEVDRAKREQDRLRKQIHNMAEREKRQEELITSQRLKQERTDSELNSIRQLYERQQRDMSLLQLNLDTARDMVSKHNDSCSHNANISLLLQSPTSGRTVAYYTGDNTVTLPGSRPDSLLSAGPQPTATSAPTGGPLQGHSAMVDSDRRSPHLQGQSASIDSDRRSPHIQGHSGSLESDRRSPYVQGQSTSLESDRRSPHMSAVGPGHHQHTNIQIGNSSSSSNRHNADAGNNSRNSTSYNNNQSGSIERDSGSIDRSEVQGSSGQKQLHENQQQRVGRSGIPVMVQGGGVPGSGVPGSGVPVYRTAGGTPRPASAIPQYRGRSLDRNITGFGGGQGRGARSESGDRRGEDGWGGSVNGYSSSGVNHHSQQGKGVGEKRYYQREPQYHQQELNQLENQSVQYHNQQQQTQQQQQQQEQIQHQQQQQQEQQQHEGMMQTVEKQLKELTSFSRSQRQQRATTEDRPSTGGGSGSIRRPTTPPPPPPQQHTELSEFRTPPRRNLTLLTSPDRRTPSPHDTSRTSGVSADRSRNSPRGGEDSVNGDYPEQTGLSPAATGGVQEDGADRSWLLEGPGDTSTGWTGASGSVSAGSYAEHQSYSGMPESPTSKLHRLLTESRQMVQSLERSTYPPFFTQEPLSPIKMDAEEEQEGEDEE